MNAKKAYNTVMVKNNYLGTKNKDVENTVR
jgi:hypothetical protein